MWDGRWGTELGMGPPQGYREAPGIKETMGSNRIRSQHPARAVQPHGPQMKPPQSFGCPTDLWRAAAPVGLAHGPRIGPRGLLLQRMPPAPEESLVTAASRETPGSSSVMAVAILLTHPPPWVPPRAAATSHSLRRLRTSGLDAAAPWSQTPLSLVACRGKARTFYARSSRAI